jgi:thiol-disulfide isomerase/thioredoxin
MNVFGKICSGFVLVAFLATCDAFLLIPAFASQLLPKEATLDENRRNELREVLKVEPNYGECRDAILQCILKEEPDKTAVRIANFCAYLISKGVPPHNLWRLIKERGKFANEEKQHGFTYSDTPVMGNPAAGITITEFAEFKCTHCVALSPVLKQLVKESNGAVRLVFKHFPIKSHHGSVTSSRAAHAAHRQGKFWEMYDLLFKDFNRQSVEDLMQHARTLNLDLARFKADMADPELVTLIEKDKMEGVRAGVRGTPTLFINGKMYNLPNDEAFLKDIINEESERLGIDPPYKEWVYGLSKR